MAKARTKKLPRFQQLQYQFAAHIRDPKKKRAPHGLEGRRMKIYRELFYNNVEDCLANAFPVLRKLSSDKIWHARVRDFYARHECHEPQFHKVAEEFLRFLEAERGEHVDDAPWLRELAHYEWVELELSVSTAELTPELADPNGDLLAGAPLGSPLAWTLAYEWPVHQIGPGAIPLEKPAQPTYLIVNRTRQDEVKFMAVNAVTARLMSLLEDDQASTGRELLLQIATELKHPQPELVVGEGGKILADLRARDIILGTRREPAYPL